MVTVNELRELIDVEFVDLDSPIEVYRVGFDDGSLTPVEIVGVSLTDDRRLRIEVV